MKEEIEEDSENNSSLQTQNIKAKKFAKLQNKNKNKFTKSACSKKFFERAQHKCIMLDLLFDNGRKNVE
jgi:hypothetical protein